MKSKRAIKMDSIANVVNKGSEWWFAGTLAEFVQIWNDNMMVLCIDKEPIVFITDCSSFGQR